MINDLSKINKSSSLDEDLAFDDLNEVHEGNHSPATPVPKASVLEDASSLLRALSAPVRIAIVLQLEAGPRCVHELVNALDIDQPLVSQHLRILKNRNVVLGERHGREIVYRLVDDHLAHIIGDAIIHVQE